MTIKLIATASPPINRNFFEKIKDEEEFANFVQSEFEYEASRGALKPICAPDLMHDAYQAYIWDMERLDKNMPRSPSPNHFKLCGLLAYWLRRHSPIVQWEKIGEDKNLSQHQKNQREILFSLGRAYQAFMLGYGVCQHFEKHSKSKVKFQQYIDVNYIETICYLMKYKSVSPQAMGIVYRSLFFAETARTADK